MLIAAMPRSASTTLATAVAELGAGEFDHDRPESGWRSSTASPVPNNPALGVDPWDPCAYCETDHEPTPERWGSLADAGARREMRNVGHYTLREWVYADRTVYRQHVMPTRHNLRYFEADHVERPFVVQVRGAEGVVQSFRRRVEAGFGGVPHVFPEDLRAMLRRRSTDVGLWRTVAAASGLLEALRRWRRRWVRYAADVDHCTIVRYTDVAKAARPRHAVGRAYQTLTGERPEFPEDWTLPRERYTRDKILETRRNRR